MMPWALDVRGPGRSYANCDLSNAYYGGLGAHLANLGYERSGTGWLCGTRSARGVSNGDNRAQKKKIP